MANILCIYENMIATVAGTEKFLKELADYDDRVSIKSVPITQLNVNDINWCDILYMIRPNNECFARLAMEVHRHGAIVVFFLDDDLMNLPKGHADMPWRKTGLANAARNSDVIVSSSPYICKRYSEKYGVPRTVVIDTAVSSKDVRPHIEEYNQRLKFVYAAGIGHKTLFDKYIKPILGDVDKKYGDKISLTFMGVHPDINPKEFRMSISFIDSMPFDEYRKKIESENFDIGLAPLDSNEFTKCKYFNKFIEYAMFGIVGIYSDTEPYTFVIKHKENGILVGNSPKDWLETICETVENQKLIDACRVASYNTIKNRFDAMIIFDKFIADIPEIVRDHKNRGMYRRFDLAHIKMEYRCNRMEDWIYKTRFYFKNGGIKEVVKGIKRKINTYRLEKQAERMKCL